jgi:acyl-CoA thioesterase-1
MTGLGPRGAGVTPGLAFAAGLAAMAAMLASAPVAVAGQLTCEVPAELINVDPDAKLPHLGARLRAGGPVKIVAIGGGSTAGLAAGSTDLAYPHRLQQTLAAWYPAVPITVVNKGVPRQTAEQMLARFPKDVFAEAPVLVIWETGTTDAVRGVDVDAFAATLQSGADAVAARGVDLILVDMQFSRRTLAVIDFDSYLRAIHRVGDVKDIYVFPRFEMMRSWSEQEVFDLDGVPKNLRASLAANVYECLGRKLADAIRIALQ